MTSPHNCAYRPALCVLAQSRHTQHSSGNRFGSGRCCCAAPGSAKAAGPLLGPHARRSSQTAGPQSSKRTLAASNLRYGLTSAAAWGDGHSRSPLDNAWPCLDAPDSDRPTIACAPVAPITRCRLSTQETYRGVRLNELGTLLSKP